jgi:hypothetical protein
VDDGPLNDAVIEDMVQVVYGGVGSAFGDSMIDVFPRLLGH